MRTPPPGTVAEFIEAHGIGALRGVPIGEAAGSTLYIADKLIDKILRERTEDGDPLGKTAWRERLYGGDAPDAELVAHIYPASSRVKSPHLLQARILESTAEALRGVEMEQLRGHLMDGARTIRAMAEQQHGLCLVVLTEGGIMEQYQTSTGPTFTDTIDCQSGEAGQIIQITPEYLPLLVQAFGPKSEWPPYIHLIEEGDVDVEICVSSDDGRTKDLKGVYNDYSHKLILGDMHPNDGYRAAFCNVQSVVFDDGRESLQAQEGTTFNLWGTPPSPGAWKGDAVNTFHLTKALQETLVPAPSSRAEIQRGGA